MVSVSYPGVYVQEVPSGVHTITGVATSIAAFFGRTQKGSMNQAVRVLSPSDFSRAFGDQPYPHSDLFHSVRQFFDNGGSDCYVVRLADEETAHKADVTLTNFAGENVLRVAAKSEGAWGNGVRLEVDYDTTNPDDTFNLRVTYEEDGRVVSEESFGNLSMDPESPRFAPTLITQQSELIDLEPHEDFADLITSTGFSQSRRPFDTADGGVPETDFRGQLTTLFATTGRLEIDISGSGFVEIDLSGLDFTTAGNADEVANLIAAAISDDPGIPPGVEVSCSWDGLGSSDFSVLRLTPTDPSSTGIRIRRARQNDLAGPMMFGISQGGIEVTRYSNLRPVPNGIVFMGNTRTTNYPDGVDILASLALSDFPEIVIDGTPITIDALGLPEDSLFYESPSHGTDGLRERLRQLARDITSNPHLPWRGGVWGYHLALQRTEGGFHVSGEVSDGPALPDGTIISNARRYALGFTGISDYQDDAGTHGGEDGDAPGVADYLGSEEDQTGFHALDSVDLFNLMVLPGDQEIDAEDFEQIITQASSYCVQHRAFLLIDAPLSWTRNHRPVATANDVDDLRGLVESDHSAVFYPRVQYSDAGIRRWIGPSGMIAGLMARTDASRGVWKAPAGIEANLRGVLDLEVNLTDRENGVLNLAAVNCLRKFPNGIVSWGARTLAGREDATSEWKYIPIRRLALFLQESLYRGTKWVVFEPNDEPLWAQIRLNLNAFMMSLFRQGAFQGSTPDKAFFVKCDNETTTQDDRNRGIVNIEVGFAPLKPAEFVIIRIQQMAGELG
jgi:phage tail sheath protein FI